MTYNISFDCLSSIQQLMVRVIDNNFLQFIFQMFYFEYIIKSALMLTYICINQKNSFESLQKYYGFFNYRTAKCFLLPYSWSNDWYTYTVSH